MARTATKFFQYGPLEIAALRSKDPVLGRAMERLGKVEREVIPDLFAALVYAIIGQLVSSKSVRTIWERMHENGGEITAAQLAMKTPDEIQAFGMTMKKAVCIHEIAHLVATGAWELERLRQLADTEVVRQLTKLNGIGQWTAEMMLIHALERPDVVSWGDIAIRRGMMKLYDLPALSKAKFDQYRSLYSPYGSVASIYLWAISFE